MLDAMDDLDLLLELPLGIAPVKPGFQSQLIQKPFIKPLGSQFGIRKVQDDIFFPGKFGIKSANEIASAIRWVDSECFRSNASRKREVVGVCPCITTGSVGSGSQNSPILTG